jgi:putative transposase
MPSRLKRFQESGQTHFLTFSCYQRRPFLNAIESRSIFESALERVRVSFGLRVYGYVVMPEHVHLLISEPDGAPFKPSFGLSGGESKSDGAPFKPLFGLSGGETPRSLADAIKSLKQGGSRRLIGEAEHFWQKRYYDLNIRNQAQFMEKLRYIHRNPVKRGLCERPEEWQWSSFRHYSTGFEGRVEIESEWISRKRERKAGTLHPFVELLPHSSQKKA